MTNETAIIPADKAITIITAVTMNDRVTSPMHVVCREADGWDCVDIFRRMESDLKSDSFSKGVRNSDSLTMTVTHPDSNGFAVLPWYEESICDIFVIADQESDSLHAEWLVQRLVDASVQRMQTPETRGATRERLEGATDSVAFEFGWLVNE